MSLSSKQISMKARQTTRQKSNTTTESGCPWVLKFTFFAFNITYDLDHPGDGISLSVVCYLNNLGKEMEFHSPMYVTSITWWKKVIFSTLKVAENKPFRTVLWVNTFLPSCQLSVVTFQASPSVTLKPVSPLLFWRSFCVEFMLSYWKLVFFQYARSARNVCGCQGLFDKELPLPLFP